MNNREATNSNIDSLLKSYKSRKKLIPILLIYLKNDYFCIDPQNFVINIHQN